jgi:RiboL-PSP-HEPN
MLLHYRELSADLERIRRYLTALATDTPTLDQRRFAYVACVSTLYASFEHFAERIAFRFTQLLLTHPKLVAITEVEKLRRRYVANASTLLSQSLGTGRYQDVTELDVAKSLTSCLDESMAYDLRLEVLSLHNSKLRWETLNGMFSWAVDDLLGGVAKSDAVEKWVALPGASGKTIAEIIDLELKELVDRRNEVAHRGIPHDILSPERMLEKVAYIDVICLALVANLATRILATTTATGESVTLGTPRKLYKDRRVAIVTLREDVSVEETVWASYSNKVRWGRVLEIRLEDETVPRANAGDEAGLLLEFAMPKTSDLYHWRNPTEDLSPLPSSIFGDRGP